ncbi:MAG TPA: hypothetical protein VGF66_12795 [Gaiellaceae bacterium]|jgi:hypothetical protein
MQGRLLRRRGIVTFAVLVLCAEVAGQALTRHVDRWLHVEPLARTNTSYYPLLLVGVKAIGALLLAALAARGLRAWAAADAGRRLLHAAGHAHDEAPRLRPGLSPRVWAASFAATSLVYLVHADTESAVAGRWPLLAPWLHTYALPVFAVLAVVIAFAWRLARFLHEIEAFADRTLQRVRSVLARVERVRQQHPRADNDTAPRRRFGLSFESRPPPLAA